MSNRPGEFIGSLQDLEGRLMNWTRRRRDVSGLLCALLCWTVLIATVGCGGGDADPSTDAASARSNGRTNSGKSSSRSAPADIPLPEVKTGVCRVYTTEPGFFVLLDGEVVRDSKNGEWLTTPCAITAPTGGHDVKVAKPGFRDASYRVTITAEQAAEAVIETAEDPLGIADSILDAPYLKAKVNEPIALSSLNSAGHETDPFVTADGLIIYFAADRSEGNGIYFATRPSPFVEFDPPQLLRTSRGSDAKATPSITADSRAVVYAMPDKQRVVALLRPDPLGDFVEKQNLQFSTRSDERWASAQIINDGLRLYWTVERKGKLETRVSNRRSIDGRFGQMRRIELPGIHPCLSHDGLRQFAFDGKKLRRARRQNRSSEFSRLEVVRELELENYVHRPLRRQYFVSDDEQWLFYSDNPDSGGDLYMVRLSEGPSWGFAASGTKIPPRTVVAVVKPEEKPQPDPEPGPPQPKVDPRTLPLPYASHWKQFQLLMRAKKYAEAKQLVERSLADEKFRQQRELLRWDREDVERIIGFWDDVRKSLRAMKPGDNLRFGSAKVALIKFEKDEITAKAKTKVVTKTIQDMKPVGLMALVEQVVEKTDEEGQARIGVFLYYDPKGGKSSAETRFERAGKAGPQFYERLAERLLRQARQEFARDNIAAGLAVIAKVSADFPKTNAAGNAKQLKREAYQFTKWQRRGNWQEGQNGEFIAGAGRAANRFLMSPVQYENFELRLEWKTNAGGAGGVFFRYRGNGDPHLFGYKIQFADDFGSGRVDPQTTGALFNETPPTANAVRKRGEWNTLRLQVRGTHAVVEINGRKVFDGRPGITDFKPLRGYVMLDGLNGGITYRKTLLIELLPAK